MTTHRQEEPLIQALDLSVELPGGRGLFRHVSFELHPGEVLWLSGPSGGGKSTLLRLLNNLASPARGRVLVEGREAGKWPPAGLRRRVSLLQQTPVMLPVQVEANLRLGFTFRATGHAAPPGAGDISRMLEGLGLGDLALNQPAGPLSVGQKQRVALARLLLLEPKVLLLDEPVASLDPESRALVEEAAGVFARGGGGVLLVSHLEPVACGTQLRALELRDGGLREVP